jgi:hypothetical protein
VVLQGIRIRMGRSLVTLTGIVLGIAFLMSILTSQSVRRGVRQETDTRAELQRMLNFLVAETGPVEGRTLGVIQVGAASDVEKRFIELLGKGKVQAFNWCGVEHNAATEGFPRGNATKTSRDDVGRNASAVLVIGEGVVPPLDWSTVLRPARQKVVALARRIHRPPEGVTGVSVVTLERKLRPEEISEMAAEARRSQFRTGWIIVISLLVTVIGICNAMLMSVTERFREIGTMKCLGALSYFIRQQFFMESCLMGLAGSLVGSLLGALVTIMVFSATYRADLIVSSLRPGELAGYGLLSVVAGMTLAIVAAIYPANFASKMVPATALRSNI